MTASTRSINQKENHARWPARITTGERDRSSAIERDGPGLLGAGRPSVLDRDENGTDIFDLFETEFV